jgi:hypothetical protein
VSYRKEYFNFGGTSVSLFLDGFNQGNTSYVFNGDLNGDGGFSNDLIYIPENVSEMNFEEYTAGETTYTVAQQQAAWEAYISQDEYLSENRGGYAERGAVFLPMVWRADFSFVQDLFVNVGGKRNTIQFRMDILNVGNLLNSDWGVGNFITNNRPLISRGVDGSGAPIYRMANFRGALLTDTFQSSAGVSDVYRIQLGVRYIFN